ncbi:hypothetical protein TNCT_472141 [Trichonephila clavata]|uniref:Uncharacterized protein n=1 Tax=Trichonephila clavata TaxID=2740835 RepID=A0A8X6H445_TRICU|nr:hypothetical protein TNCT_472141 [Trichonephila clavata]
MARRNLRQQNKKRRNHASFLPGRQFAAYATVPRSIVPPSHRRGRIANAKRHCFNPRTRFENKRHKRSRRKIREGIYPAD